MIYTDFSVKNYRGIRQCKLEKLELINLFFGKNNCGKSSLLESLFILSGPDNPTLPILANKSRALDSLEETDLKIAVDRAEFGQGICIFCEDDTHIAFGAIMEG